MYCFIQVVRFCNTIKKSFHSEYKCAESIKCQTQAQRAKQVGLMN